MKIKLRFAAVHSVKSRSRGIVVWKTRSDTVENRAGSSMENGRVVV